MQKTPLLSLFRAQNDHFAKTGSGQTQGKLKKRDSLFAGATIYPHLMDAQSPSRNFDVIGANSTQVWFQFITGVPGHVPCYRAGVAVPVTITHG